MKQQNLLHSFLKYVSLNVAGMVGLSCYILADTFFVANRLGENGLASLNLAISLYSVLNAVGLMLGIGGATRYAVLRARGDTRQAGRVFSHTLLLAGAAALLFLAAGLFFSRPLASLLGADAQTLDMTAVYLQTLFCFSPCFLLNNLILAFTRNDGRPRLAMAAMLLGSFSNILLDYLFLYPLGWGMFGAAFATGLAPVISLALLSVQFVKRKNGFRPSKEAFSLREAGRICALGGASFVTELSSGAALMVFNRVILSLEGNTGVAAYGIVANLALVAVAVFVGISQGMQPLISRSRGMGDGGAMKRVLRYGAAGCLGMAVLLLAVVVCFAQPLAGVFNRDGVQALESLAVRGLRLYFPGFLFAGVNIAAASFFSSAELPKTGLLLSLLRGFGAILPAVLLLSALLGMDGVWLSFPCAEAVTLLAGAFCLRRAGKKGLFRSA